HVHSGSIGTHSTDNSYNGCLVGEHVQQHDHRALLRCRTTRGKKPHLHLGQPGGPVRQGQIQTCSTPPSSRESFCVGGHTALDVVTVEEVVPKTPGQVGTVLGEQGVEGLVVRQDHSVVPGERHGLGGVQKRSRERVLGATA